MYALTIWGAGAKPPSPLHPECEHSVLLFMDIAICCFVNQ